MDRPIPRAPLRETAVARLLAAVRRLGRARGREGGMVLGMKGWKEVRREEGR
jgi:hypothetical protein